MKNVLWDAYSWFLSTLNIWIQFMNAIVIQWIQIKPWNSHISINIDAYSMAYADWLRVYIHIRQPNQIMKFIYLYEYGWRYYCQMLTSCVYSQMAAQTCVYMPWDCDGVILLTQSPQVNHISSHKLWQAWQLWFDGTRIGPVSAEQTSKLETTGMRLLKFRSLM